MAGKVIIISGPSAAGKTSIVNHLKSIDDFQLVFSISATSRPKREGEEDGRDYYFMSIDKFRNRIEENEFIEWEEVYKNNYYGTLKMEINRIRGNHKNVLFDVDVAGAMSLKRHFKTDALALFIQPPSTEELKNRLYSRGLDKEEDISKRLRKAKYELTYARKFDKAIDNENLNTAKQEAENAVREFLN